MGALLFGLGLAALTLLSTIGNGEGQKPAQLPSGGGRPNGGTGGKRDDKPSSGKRDDKPASGTSSTSSTSAPSLPSHPVAVVDATPATPATKPTTQAEDLAALGRALEGMPPIGGSTKKQHAQALYDYVVKLINAGKAAQLGDKHDKNETVQKHQAGMGLIAADGIYGDKTRKRGRELLGREFPPRVNPKQRVAPPSTVATRPSAAAAPVRDFPVPGTAMVSTAPSAAAPAKPKPPQPATPAQRSSSAAATDLYSYVRNVANMDKTADRSRGFGTKDAPNATVRAAQADMGELTADGIYGPKTRERGKALINKTFPPRI